MLNEIKGIGPSTEKKLNELRIFSPIDFIKRIPKSYMDLSVITSPLDATEGQFCFFEGCITKISKPFKKGKLEILKSVCTYEGEAINLVWFNRNYIVKILKIDQKYNIYGKLKIENNKLFFYNPIFEEKNENSKFSGIHPIYWTKGLIPQKTYSKFVEKAFGCAKIESVIDKSIEEKYNLTDLNEAYYNVHFPKSADIKKYGDRIVTENIVRRICAFKITQKSQYLQKSRKYIKDIDHSPFYKFLPFELNESQKNAVEKIEKSLCSDKHLNAILCGDVGSGKTAVALTATYFAVMNGYKVAVMAPTEILAKQHYDNFSSLFDKLGINVCFLSGSTKNAEKNRIKNLIENDFFKVIVGTHSLINADFEIPDLGFVIMDEQHRFGVSQRTQLIKKGEAVDILTLSATPIPRSMQLVAYGEVEFITIERRFACTVKTALVGKEKREDMWRYIAKECGKGNLAYVVVPQIFDTDGAESHTGESVESVSEELKKYFDAGEIGILHGKMKSEEKEKILNEFKGTKRRILVSTTVIEVGIDVPEASFMVILNAERFGLATLHQLRGRVGRNGQEAYCFLYSENAPSEGLKIMRSCNNGFEIAEKDFELRGGGDIFGLEQSGSGTLNGLTLSTLNKAKKIADEINPSEVAEYLTDEIKSFYLNEVSLN